MQFLEREHDFLLLLLLPARWDANQMTGTPGAVLDHEVTLGWKPLVAEQKDGRNLGLWHHRASFQLWTASL